MATRQSQGKVIAVAGATGAVGDVLLRVLEERDFPVRELRALASERSAGTARVRFRGEELPVEVARPEAFDGADFVFFAATGALSRTLAPEAVKRGAVAIDKSSTWRMTEGVPLVVPEINPGALDKHRGIVSCPNCTTIPFVMVLEALRRAGGGLGRIVTATYQSVSGAGKPGMEELDAQIRAAARGEPLRAAQFPAPILGNVLPAAGAFTDDGYSDEEIKLVEESRKIMELPTLEISMTCVRVPVPVGHSHATLVETVRPLRPEQARAALAAFPGIVVMDDPKHNVFPSPALAAGRDEVLVGRIRKDFDSDRLWLFLSSDNLRKGAATNAVQTAEEMMRRGLA
jgi:aspartate-semialdehyde dehydrogenase